jgi:hypothetical protein
MYTRDYTNVPVLEPPQLVLVRMPGQAKCGECGGDAVATLRAGATGYSMGTDHLHARTCSAISCPHGKIYSEPCQACHEQEKAARTPLMVEAAVKSLRSWAFTDSRVELNEQQLRQCLVDDIGAGTEPPCEVECQVFICGDDEGEIPPGLVRRFPKTHAWLEEQLT